MCAGQEMDDSLPSGAFKFVCTGSNCSPHLRPFCPPSCFAALGKRTNLTSHYINSLCPTAAGRDICGGPRERGRESFSTRAPLYLRRKGHILLWALSFWWTRSSVARLGSTAGEKCWFRNPAQPTWWPSMVGFINQPSIAADSVTNQLFLSCNETCELPRSLAFFFIYYTPKKPKEDPEGFCFNGQLVLATV